MILYAIGYIVFFKWMSNREWHDRHFDMDNPRWFQAKDLPGTYVWWIALPCIFLLLSPIAMALANAIVTVSGIDAATR